MCVQRKSEPALLPIFLKEKSPYAKKIHIHHCGFYFWFCFCGARNNQSTARETQRIRAQHAGLDVAEKRLDLVCAYP